MKSIAFIISIVLVGCTTNQASQNSKAVAHPITVKKAHIEDTKPAGINERFLDKASQLIPANVDMLLLGDLASLRKFADNNFGLFPKLKQLKQMK
ncbi:MAG TPA: hypothetical protein EYN66_18690, partial [Myxococcales bacterium]|nr:hypothetical protein [Myxococcales bacterium]